MVQNATWLTPGDTFGRPFEARRCIPGIPGASALREASREVGCRGEIALIMDAASMLRLGNDANGNLAWEHSDSKE
jgi:hypothetical protein